jgi:hypothetical protein
MSVQFFSAFNLWRDVVQAEQSSSLARERDITARREFIADRITRTPPYVA